MRQNRHCLSNAKISVLVISNEKIKTLVSVSAPKKLNSQALISKLNMNTTTLIRISIFFPCLSWQNYILLHDFELLRTSNLNNFLFSCFKTKMYHEKN